MTVILHISKHTNTLVSFCGADYTEKYPKVRICWEPHVAFMLEQYPDAVLCEACALMSLTDPTEPRED